LRGGTGLEHGDDVRVRERRADARLAQEARDGVGVGARPALPPLAETPIPPSLAWMWEREPVAWRTWRFVIGWE
jgi:hypothetical protein